MAGLRWRWKLPVAPAPISGTVSGLDRSDLHRTANAMWKRSFQRRIQLGVNEYGAVRPDADHFVFEFESGGVGLRGVDQNDARHGRLRQLKGMLLAGRIEKKCQDRNRCV